MRLKKVLPSIIVIKYANSENISAAILFIDQEKAFDGVSHSFLIKTLKQFNFGPAFISWIETILTDIKSQVKVNGYLTEEINITL